MNTITKIQKVKNGWVGFNEFGDVVSVAGNDAQLAEMMQIKPVSVTPIYPIDVNIDCNAIQNVMINIRNGHKIDAIKELRRAFSEKYDGQEIRIGLRDSKEFVEIIQRFIDK